MTLGRSLLVGLAAGSRSTLGGATPLLVSRRRVVRVVGVVAVVGELAGDKLPHAPSRLRGRGPVYRLASGAAGAVTLARRERGLRPKVLLVAAVAGAAGAAAGTWGGAAWRATAARRGWPDWPAAVAEDAVALTAAWVAARPVSRSAPDGR
jgi:uncharacterized membrane protein